MIVKIKKLKENAKIPSYAKPGDCAMDITATSKRWDEYNKYYEYGSGISLEIPEGYVGLVFPRSSLSNQDLLLTNSVGVIDSSYRGEITFRFKETRQDLKTYKVGDRIGQLMIIPYPKIEFEEVEELSNTERGASGYGSSGV